MSTYTLANGYQIEHINKNETDFLYREIFEDKTYLKHGILINDNACVFDVGANIGLFSLFVFSNSINAKIFAFEPVPEIFKVLKMNSIRHNWNINLFNVALSNINEKKNFTYYPKSSLQSGYYANPLEDKKLLKATALKQQQEIGTSFNMHLLDKLIEDKLKPINFLCESITISQIIKQYEIKNIDLLKIDVERSELNVIQGIALRDWSKIKQVVVEVDHETDTQLIYDLLLANDFNIAQEQYTPLANTNVYMLYAKKNNYSYNL